MPLATIGAAHVEVLGVGCGTNAPPRLESSGFPVIGDAGFALELANALPNTPAAITIAAQPIVPGTCTLMVIPVITIGTQTDTAGHAQTPVPIPMIPSLVGASLYAQGLVINPAGPLAGVADATNGLRVLIGQAPN